MVLATASVCALSLSACTAVQPAPQTEFVDSAGYVEEYRHSVAAFTETLPEGVDFPETPPPLEGNIEKSVGNAMAHFFWLCSWEAKYLSEDSTEEQLEALEQIKRFADTDWAQVNYDDSSGAWANAIEYAELGDPSELRAFHESDCAGFGSAFEAAQ